MKYSKSTTRKAKNMLYNNQKALLLINTHANYYSEYSINYVINNNGLISFNANIPIKYIKVKVTIFHENKKEKLEISGQLESSDNENTRYKQFFSTQHSNTNYYTVKIQDVVLTKKKQKSLIPIQDLMINTCFSEEEEKNAIRNINACLTCTPYWPRKSIKILSFTSEGLWFSQKNKTTYLPFNSNIRHVSLIKAIMIAFQKSQSLYEIKKIALKDTIHITHK